MQAGRKSLKELKTEVKSYGYTVQDWAKLAGINWKSLYRKISDPRSLLLDEYDRLEQAARELRKTKKVKP